MVRIWNAAKGALTKTLVGHKHIVTSAAFSPDGRLVVSGGWDNSVMIWNSHTGTLFRTLRGHGAMVRAVAFSPDGKYVASGAVEGDFLLWSVRTGKAVRKFEGHAIGVTSLSFSHDGRRILSTSDDYTARLWETKTGRLLRTFLGHQHWVWSGQFAPTDKQIISGSADRTIKLWDIDTGELLKTFVGHAGSVIATRFSSDGGRIISVGQDTTTRIWNLATGDLLTTFFSATRGDWLAMTPNGFFNSYGHGGIVGIVRGMHTHPVDQVFQSLFSPDLVREALAGDPNGEVAAAAKVINLEKVLDSGPAPDVAISTPNERSDVHQDVTVVTTRITDKGRGVGRIEWRMNGVTAAVAAKPEGGGPVYTLKRELALDPGENVIEVVAYNGSNLLASLPARTTVTYTGPAEAAKPKLHILAIGINSYADKGYIERGRIRRGWQPLKLAVKDAQTFGAEMKRAAGSLYSEVRLTPVLESEATRDNLEQVVSKIAKDIHPRDTFILFAAAHGTSENGRFYLIPQDYQGGPGALQERAIGQDQLQEWLANRIKAKKALILLDTCESGALVAGHLRSRTEEAASEASVGRLHEATGRPVLTAAARGQFAHEGLVAASGGRQGIFTWALLGCLEEWRHQQ